MELGKKIAFYRKKMDMTQEALANQLGISNQAVSKWETEQSYPDVELLPRIADIFEITLDELFDRVKASEDEEQPTEEMIGNSAGEQVQWFWEDDDTLRAVLFMGHQLVEKKELNRSMGRIFSEITLNYSGEVKNIESSFNVTCENVGGSVSAGGYVECGDAGGDVTAGGYVECGDVAQSVKAGGYVECGDVGVSVTAGGYAECEVVGVSVSARGYVECGDAGGDVTAGGYVNCGDVGGNVTAEENVECGDVGGNVKAGGNVECGDVEGRIINN